jgi:hypothetical protein
VIASSLNLLLLLAMVRAYNQTRKKQRLCQSRRSHPYLTPNQKAKEKKKQTPPQNTTKILVLQN